MPCFFPCFFCLAFFSCFFLLLFFFIPSLFSPYFFSIYICIMKSINPSMIIHTLPLFARGISPNKETFFQRTLIRFLSAFYPFFYTFFICLLSVYYDSNPATLSIIYTSYGSSLDTSLGKSVVSLTFTSSNNFIVSLSRPIPRPP